MSPPMSGDREAPAPTKHTCWGPFSILRGLLGVLRPALGVCKGQGTRMGYSRLPQLRSAPNNPSPFLEPPHPDPAPSRWDGNFLYSDPASEPIPLGAGGQLLEQGSSALLWLVASAVQEPAPAGHRPWGTDCRPSTLMETPHICPGCA